MKRIRFDDNKKSFFITEIQKNEQLHLIDFLDVDDYNVCILFNNRKTYHKKDIEDLFISVRANFILLLSKDHLKQTSSHFINLLEKESVSSVSFEIDLVKTVESKLYIDIFIFDRFSNLIGKGFVVYKSY